MAASEMFDPVYSISTSTIITGNTSYVLLATSSPVIVQGVRMQQSGTASETVVSCSNGIIGYNYAKDYPLDLLNMKCLGGITVHKTGNDTSFVSVTYLPYYASTTREITASTSPTTSPAYYMGFSYDGIMISFLLLLIFSMAFFGGIMRWTYGSKTRKIVFK